MNSRQGTYGIVGSLVVIGLIVVTAGGCDLIAVEGGAGGTTYAVGDTGPAGGIVFYDDEADGNDDIAGARYLEVWTSDEAGTYEWQAGAATRLGTSTDVGSGYENTYTKMSGPGHPAAEVVRNASHGGFSDWHLPSKDELDLIWDNLVVDGAGNNSGVGGFADDYYWSSSEGTRILAWVQIFLDGGQFTDFKDSSSVRVRAVRAF